MQWDRYHDIYLQMTKLKHKEAKTIPKDRDTKSYSHELNPGSVDSRAHILNDYTMLPASVE